MAAVRSARRVVATHCDRAPLEALSANLRLNSSRLVVERLRACHLAWGDNSHLLQALRQAPEPPGCFNAVLSAGLIEGCLSVEADNESGERGAAPSGGIRDALRTARRLVEMHQRGKAPPSISALDGSSGGSVVGAFCGGDGGDEMSPAPDSFTVLVERKGVLAEALALGQLNEALSESGWECLQSISGGDSGMALLPEVLTWLDGPCPMGTQWAHSAGGRAGEHLEVLFLTPVVGRRVMNPMMQS